MRPNKRHFSIYHCSVEFEFSFAGLFFCGSYETNFCCAFCLAHLKSCISLYKFIPRINHNWTISMRFEHVRDVLNPNEPVVKYSSIEAIEWHLVRGLIWELSLRCFYFFNEKEIDMKIKARNHEKTSIRQI